MQPIRFEGVYDPTIWKPVEGAEGYFVNMEGKVKGRRGRVLRGSLRGGYPSIKAGREGFVITCHRAVAKAFIGDIPKGWVVNHIDEDKANPRVTNLEICTQSHNVIHSVKNRTPQRKSTYMSNLMFWKKVPNFDSLYAHPSGLVGTLQKSPKRIRILFGNKLPNGYVQYHSNFNGIRKGEYGHRIVAATFIDNPLNLPIVNHINGNRTDNSLGNLEWCTQQHNMRHKTAQKLPASITFKEKEQRRVVAKDASGEIVVTFESAAEAGRNGFTPSCVGDCCLGYQKTHKGLYWSFA